MGSTIGFRIGDSLEDELKAHLDEIEAQTGYRPNKSDVVRDALREKLGTASEPAEAEGAC